MSVAEGALAVAVLFAGPWSGLLAMLTTILHPMLAAMDGRSFRIFLGSFLRFARKAWFNYACSIGMGVAPIVALTALWDDRSGAAFILTAIGWVAVILGVYVVANVWKEPHYDVMLSWNPEAMPSDWEQGRRRYFTLNWINAGSTWAAFVLFLGASQAV